VVVCQTLTMHCCELGIGDVTCWLVMEAKDSVGEGGFKQLV